MKTIKQILESHNIKEDTLYHNHSYVYSDIYDAMMEFGNQSFIKGFCDGDEYSGEKLCLSNYLKQVENDTL